MTNNEDRSTLQATQAMKSIRIGNGAGFWGDNLDAPRLLAESGQLDYLTLEYLAELTLSILAHLKSREPDAGFVTDFPVVIQSLIPALKKQTNLKIVTNAGGMNPTACAVAISTILSSAGLGDIPVAAVTGDDLLPQLDSFIKAGETFSHFETEKPLGDLQSQIASANAYLGASGIVDALQEGARIVITGRVADASLTVGPAVHEFGWNWSDWDKLATATVTGHLIECGAQVTGGMFSDWSTDSDLSDVGYPIAELTDDGSIEITKPEGTAGLVSIDTVAEQLIYEIGDPAHYLTPDVDADFSNVQLTQAGSNRVRVERAIGNPAPKKYKVSMAYRDGFSASGTLVVCGKNAAEKARTSGQIILDRLRRAGIEFEQTNIEVLGAGDSMPGLSQFVYNPWEVVLRVSAHDQSRDAIDRFTREFAPLVTSGPPGITGYTGPRAKTQPQLAYWPTSISREAVTSIATVKSAEEWQK